MTSIKAARSTTNGHTGPPLTQAVTPLPVRQKRPGLAALAVILIVGFALLGAYLYQQAGAKVPVVEVVRDVPAGHVITRGDVTTIDVAGPVTAIGASNIESVVGESATVELLPNTLLQRAMLSTSPGLDSAHAQVGVQVSAGQAPALALAPGDHVRVLELPNDAADQGAVSSGASTPPPADPETVLVADAVVYAAVADPSESGGNLVTLVVPIDASSAVAAASDAHRVALIRIGR